MIKIIPPDRFLKFIPSAQKDSDKPTIFFVRPESMSTSMLRNRMFDFRSKDSISMASEQRWIEYIVARVAQIENVEEHGQLKTLRSKAEIEGFISCPFEGAYEIGTELISFLINNAGLAEDDKKN